ncbi:MULTISPECIES: glycosyltransferase [Methylocaldum]|jgi:glycosyltransferase involved in cell wall biosynthesis|uniref:glycosyltransferase n=1 Tax=Methylocaldum sp. GT1BB TaxID=3438963 RepID=UPI003D9FDFE3
MNIGVLTTSFPLRTNPSSGVFVQRLVAHLAQHANVSVITPASNIAFIDCCSLPYAVRFFCYAPRRFQTIAHQPGGIPVALRNHRWLVLLMPLFIAAMFLSCLRHFRHMDIIHANWAACGAIAGMAGCILGIPVITTLRGSDVARIQNSVIDRIFLKTCLATNRKIVCVSDAICTLVGQFFPTMRNKLLVIPNGVADEFLLIDRNYQVSDFGITFITIGNLTPLKSIHTAIEAFAKANIENSRLIVIGDGPEKARLEQLAQHLKVGKHVHFLGVLPPEEIPAQLFNADVFVFTSVSEGRPNAILEAMAAGLPLAATSIDGVAELVIDSINGLLFEPGNSDILASHLKRLAFDTALRRKLGSSAKQSLIDQDLTWNRTAESYLQVYKPYIHVASSR